MSHLRTQSAGEAVTVAEHATTPVGLTAKCQPGAVARCAYVRCVEGNMKSEGGREGAIRGCALGHAPTDRAIALVRALLNCNQPMLHILPGLSTARDR